MTVFERLAKEGKLPQPGDVLLTSGWIRKRVVVHHVDDKYLYDSGFLERAERQPFCSLPDAAHYVYESIVGGDKVEN